MKKIVLFLLPVILISLYSIGFSQDTKENEARYYIEISISECKLWLYQIENDYSRKLVKEYPVGTVKKGKRIFPVGKGVVTRKEYHPTWNPTEETRNEFAKRGVELPEVVPPGHPQNYMGSFKIYLSHFVPGKGDIYRIHGSRKEDEDKIGHRVSSGCIRMKNSDGEELARIIPVGTEVNIVL